MSLPEMPRLIAERRMVGKVPKSAMNDEVSFPVKTLYGLQVKSSDLVVANWSRCPCRFLETKYIHHPCDCLVKPDLPMKSRSGRRVS